MKQISLAAGVAIVVIANSFALLHAAWNRYGASQAEITLTNRELRYFGKTLSDDDSGVTLNLAWVTPDDSADAFPQGTTFTRWLDRQKLEGLGFDCGVDPGKEEALRFYERQRPRRGFVALEHEGQAWRVWLDNYNQAAERRRAAGGPLELQHVPEPSHLIAIDADPDANTLRARHPDRSKIVIVPAVIAIGLDPYPYLGRIPDRDRPVQIVGRIQQLASSIHVPRPFSDSFRDRDQRKGAKDAELSYVVRLRYGNFLEPWVVGLNFNK